jgi:hypothetical protein
LGGADLEITEEVKESLFFGEGKQHQWQNLGRK